MSKVCFVRVLGTVAAVALLLFPTLGIPRNLTPDFTNGVLSDQIIATLDSLGIDVAEGDACDVALSRSRLTNLRSIKLSKGGAPSRVWEDDFRQAFVGALAAIRTTSTASTENEFKMLWSHSSGTRVFLSFTRQDLEQAHQIAQALRSSGFNAFLYLNEEGTERYEIGSVAKMLASAEHVFVLDTDHARNSRGVWLEYDLVTSHPTREFISLTIARNSRGAPIEAFVADMYILNAEVISGMHATKETTKRLASELGLSPEELVARRKAIHRYANDTFDMVAKEQPHRGHHPVAMESSLRRELMLVPDTSPKSLMSAYGAKNGRALVKLGTLQVPLYGHNQVAAILNEFPRISFKQLMAKLMTPSPQVVRNSIYENMSSVGLDEIAYGMAVNDLTSRVRKERSPVLPAEIDESADFYKKKLVSLWALRFGAIDVDHGTINTALLTAIGSSVDLKLSDVDFSNGTLEQRNLATDVPTYQHLSDEELERIRRELELRRLKMK